MGNNKSLKYLGTLHGCGALRACDGGTDLGCVTYEIDGYLDGRMRSANGRIEGDVDTLGRAFRAGTVSLALADGSAIEMKLSDPCGGPMAEVRVIGSFPL
jgi:hypothetical protein